MSELKKTAEEIAAAEAAAAAEVVRIANAAAASDAVRPKAEVKPVEHQMGDKLLVSGCIAAQVNPLTNQRISKDQPVIALYDAWIKIQLEAGVLVEASM